MKTTCSDCRTQVQYDHDYFYGGNYLCEWCGELRDMREANAPVPSRVSLMPEVAKGLVADQFGLNGIGLFALLFGLLGVCVCIPVWVAVGIWWPTLLLVSLYVAPVVAATEKRYKIASRSNRAALSERWNGWSGRY